MKISIVTVTYNSEKTLEETFESVLQQKFRPLEYVVVDGGSKDSTLDIIKRYERIFEENGISYLWSSERDKGISDAFNKGIKRASGELIGIINSDDKLAENALVQLAEAYNSSDDVYFGDCIVFNDSDSNQFVAKPTAAVNISGIVKGMIFYHPSTFITQNAYNKYGVYDINMKYCMDRELLLRFFRSGAKFVYINKPLAYYREGGVNQVNHMKCVRENRDISIKYGMPYWKAHIRMIYGIVHDKLWMLIKRLGLEKMFHHKL